MVERHHPDRSVRRSASVVDGCAGTGRCVPLAVDGSRISVPRTKDNEKAFCAPNFGKSRKARSRRKKKAKSKRLRHRVKEAQPVKPQIWVTLLWHMGLQMPWSWKTGP